MEIENNALSLIESIMSSISAQAAEDAKKASETVSGLYGNIAGQGPRLNMIAYDDLA